MYGRISSLILLFMTVATLCKSQTVADMWISMPAEFTPYLTLNQKKEMVECEKAGVDNSVKNKLDGTTSIDTIMVDYAKISLSSARDVQLIMLPFAEGDSIVCIIDSYQAPAVQSKVGFYSHDWRKLNDKEHMPILTMADFIHCPDTMSVADYDELCKLLELEYIALNYNPEAKCLEATLSTPLVTTEEKERLQAILCKKTLIWNGRSFN